VVILSALAVAFAVASSRQPTILALAMAVSSALKVQAPAQSVNLVRSEAADRSRHVVDSACDYDGAKPGRDMGL